MAIDREKKPQRGALDDTIPSAREVRERVRLLRKQNKKDKESHRAEFARTKREKILEFKEKIKEKVPRMREILRGTPDESGKFHVGVFGKAELDILARTWVQGEPAHLYVFDPYWVAQSVPEFKSFLSELKSKGYIVKVNRERMGMWLTVYTFY